MVNTSSTYQLLRRLWLHLNRKRRYQFFLLLGLMLVVSLAEVLSIGAILPFLGVLTAPEKIFEYPRFASLFQFLGYDDARQLLLPTTIIFIVATLVSAVMRLCLLWFQTKFSHAVGANISHAIYWKALHQPYLIHTQRNSSELIASIIAKSSQIVYNIVLPLLIIISSSFLLLIILLVLMTIDWRVSVSALIGFGFIYGLVMIVTKRRLFLYSKQINQEQGRVIKALQEGLGGIRDVLIDSSQNFYSLLYKRADQKLRNAQAYVQIIGGSPRYFVEALGMILIAVLSYSLAIEPNGFTNAIPFLGAMALAAQRLLPALQQSYFSWSSIQGNRDSLSDTLNLLDQPMPKYYLDGASKPIQFHRSLRVENLSFSYDSQNKLVLRDIHFDVAKGDRVGIVGGTGSGKTTLMDILMGLLQPLKGRILVDDHVVSEFNIQSWQKHIAHVPQSIFLADATIAENIAFGLPAEEIDLKKVYTCAKRAQISSTIDSWVDGYNTQVGERGIRLSGGQRQRIGIARALYKDADVLFFDEATSALDGETEATVMDAIESLDSDLTIFMIAHRLTTLKQCNIVIELDNGSIKQIGSYQQIIGV